MNWRKSSFSFSNGNCVEVSGWRKPRRSYGGGACVEAGDWRKSSASMADGNCAEVASDAASVAVRDTQDREGPVLKFSADAWRVFTVALKLG
jgi:hypothetical protein